MKLVPFSPKQLKTLCWWCERSRFKEKTAVICDGAVRSGKTICMGISFICWAFYRFSDTSFAICGKTIRSVRRNLVGEIMPVLKELGFSVEFKVSENLLIISGGGKTNKFYLFGGRDEGSAALIQGMTLGGVLFDEVALMPRSFVEQALARCSLEGAKFWFNCNPENPQHWFYREWILKKSEKKALYIHFTMRDNPSLSKETIERYQNLFSGTFYERFIEGKWVAALGLVYPFASELLCDAPPSDFERFSVSCDYGTVNPASFGLWGLQNGTWYRIDEYYFSSREMGVQRTDEEHYQALEKLCEGKKIDCVTVDPSAASFIAAIERHGKFRVKHAVNNVLDGIRLVGGALKEGRIKICKNCLGAAHEFQLYRWSDDLSKDAPLKENDHAMDDIRYFVTTILEKPNDNAIAFAIRRGDNAAEWNSSAIGGKGEDLWDY